jgi:hypothetical protein
MRPRNTRVSFYCSVVIFNITCAFLPIAKDDAAVARVQAKNAFETYVYNLRNSINEEKPADKFDSADKSNSKSTVRKAIS